ncbi:hypothetical protein F4560_001750 [Saccharothrix ecbatanensis]|uniref:Uncharacterized protein n=1 Tax=Saccharothrix ecbatanensis TaxID=1105145 RepID=A0A7W9HGS1_9PSEU|nr:hypothetical protein [Saccharothrix ecbatanensis]MBB5801982.1 hypothetical protein [Saccharothrix ecbatanensis]
MDEWARLGNQAANDAIKRLTMPKEVGGGGFAGAAAAGLDMSGFIRNFDIRTIFVNF